MASYICLFVLVLCLGFESGFGKQLVVVSYNHTGNGAVFEVHRDMPQGRILQYRPRATFVNRRLNASHAGLILPILHPGEGLLARWAPDRQTLLINGQYSMNPYYGNGMYFFWKAGDLDFTDTVVNLTTTHISSICIAKCWAN